jgi:hypothetical protein
VAFGDIFDPFSVIFDPFSVVFGPFSPFSVRFSVILPFLSLKIADSALFSPEKCSEMTNSRQTSGEGGSLKKKTEKG